MTNAVVLAERHLPAEAARLATAFASAQKASSTLRAYRSDLRRFAAWRGV